MMELIIIGVSTLIANQLLQFVFGYKRKILQHIGENDELDELAKKYPNNREMCKEYLEMIHNTKVKIEENKGAEASFYMAITDKIFIGDIQKSYTRIQTLAHECLHSIQNRRMLMFNFLFSNMYLIYFLTISILLFFKVLPYKMMFLAIFLILSMMYYTVRIFLENDAMIKARYLAKEYMGKKGISTTEEIDKLVQGFDHINAVGINYMNYHFFMEIMMKTFILTALCLIF